MKVYISGGTFIADGDYQECASWAYSMIQLERDNEAKVQKDAAEKEAAQMNELLNMPIVELMRREKEECESHE